MKKLASLHSSEANCLTYITHTTMQSMHIC